MKHIWCIDDYRFTLKEGYVLDDYKDYEDDFVYSDEAQKSRIGIYKVEIFLKIKKLLLVCIKE